MADGFGASAAEDGDTESGSWGEGTGCFEEYKEGGEVALCASLSVYHCRLCKIFSKFALCFILCPDLDAGNYMLCAPIGHSCLEMLFEKALLLVFM